MINDKIINFAKKQGYDSALYIGKWKNYEAYEPIFDNNSDVSFIGPPLLILVENDKIRMSTVEEAFNQLEASTAD